MDDETKADRIVRTAEIVAAFVANNSVTVAAIPDLIASVHGVLASLGQPVEAAPVADYSPAVSVRKSLASRDHILSMIDGKPYSTLKRHLGGHGLPPAQYRARFNLPADYPMVAPAYSERRSATAKAQGLGRKPGQTLVTKAAATNPAPVKAASPKPAKTASAKADPVAKTPGKTASTPPRRTLKLKV